MSPFSCSSLELVHPPRIEDSRGIERILQPAVDLGERGLERMEDGDALVAAAKQRRVAAEALRGRADRERLELRAEPPQSPAPFDELCAGGADRLRGLRERDPPERARLRKEIEAVIA